MKLFGKKQEQRTEELLYQRDKRELTRLLSEMGDTTETALRQAIRSLLERNSDLAGQVIAGDDQVDDLEVSIEQECLRSIGMRQPVRDDLRFVFSVLKIITDLERMGDQAVNIAKTSMELNRRPLFKPLEDTPRMAEQAVTMMSNALQAFTEEDAELALQVFKNDATVDRYYAAIFEEIMVLLARGENSERGDIERAMRLVLVARALERVGDHAANIAERAYFMVTGGRIKEEIRRREGRSENDAPAGPGDDLLASGENGAGRPGSAS
ncbi:MAG: phosphate signaling complex protein PhoU [Synergistales bacterium]|nr:phosphate signaling complex protein PhoU [Synergistales bacterium]